MPSRFSRGIPVPAGIVRLVSNWSRCAPVLAAPFAATIPTDVARRDSGANGAMIGIRTNIDPWWSQWWPGSARPNRRSANDTAGRRDDTFKQSVAELSRRASERLARQSAVDPGAAAQSRRAALLALDRAHARRLRWALGFVVGVVAGTGVAALVATINAPTAPAPAIATAPPDPTPSVELASVAQTTNPAQEPSPPSAEPAPATVVSDGQAPAAASPSALTPNASEPPLKHEEVRELQARLQSFGFNPGPVDGIAGRTTEGAALRYQQERAQPQTGKVDRELLERLRQDPAPQIRQQVAQRAARPAPRPTSSSTGARRADPMQPVKDGFDHLGRWLDSVFR